MVREECEIGQKVRKSQEKIKATLCGNPDAITGLTQNYQPGNQATRQQIKLNLGESKVPRLNAYQNNQKTNHDIAAYN